MIIRKELLACAVALTFAASGGAFAAGMQSGSSSSGAATSPPSSMSSETTGQATGSAAQMTLTAQQKKEIFQAAQSMPEQKSEQSALTPGSKVPSGVSLSPLPQSAQQSISDPALKSAQVAKLQNGDVIVADSSKIVQAVITPEDANSTTGQGASGAMSSPSSSK